ncbi:molybdopterin-guanine dinucleotide biosynthesis protein B [Hydrogenophaga sp. T2]|uniref:molybdopterin-guanine dinucleotide biosynthesis protein B n=1 Tax=Hydrogenophaga sp. T2 TaxID=3132823 RepID=UPI003CF63E29
MHVVGFAGFSGSGKTTLVEQLIPALRLRGLRVAVIKHAHHNFDIDHPGKDTWRHREAGALEIVAASPRRLVVMREFEAGAEHDVHALIARLSAGPDWVLVEGFKRSSLPKVEVWREASGQPVIYPGQPQVLAIATDSPAALPEPPARPVLDLNAPDDLAAWLVDNASRFHYTPPDET